MVWAGIKMNSDSTSEVVFRDSRDQIVERAKAAGIPFNARSYPDPRNTSIIRQRLQISLPSGREKVDVTVSAANAESVLNTDFESWVVLGDYNAVLDKKLNTIEALITGPIPYLRRIAERQGDRNTNDASESEDFVTVVADMLESESTSESTEWSFAIPISSKDLSVTISPGSARMCIDMFWRADTTVIGGRDRRGASLKIFNVSAATHDEALEILEQYSRSIFFELDLNMGTMLSLSRRSERAVAGIEFGVRMDGSTPLGTVANAYASEAVTLYAYGRSAHRMPLLEFLAYYQAVEYFFPSFVNADILKRVRIKLRDPRFDVENDSDIRRIVSAASGNPQGGQPREREQLRITLESCLDDTEVKDFISDMLDGKEFFSSKCRIRGAQPLRFDEKGTGSFVRQVADRVYGIRCRIVHSKESADSEIQPALLPFGTEARELLMDIALARYLAQKVIIAGSRGRL